MFHLEDTCPCSNVNSYTLRSQKPLAQHLMSIFVLNYKLEPEKEIIWINLQFVESLGWMSHLENFLNLDYTTSTTCSLESRGYKPICIQRLPTSGISINNGFVLHVYNHAKQVVSATTWCNNNIFACIIEPKNWTICDKHQLWISYRNNRRIFNGKGSGSHSISIGHELDLMDQFINPYFVTAQFTIQGLKL
jgi:hypothetical protein